MSLDPKVIARFDSVGEAEAAKSALDAANIPSALSDENMVAIDWLYSRAIGGIRLMVAEENADAALEVLNATAEGESTPEREREQERDELQPRCPECGSSNVVPSRRFEALALLAIAILGVGAAIDQIELSALAVAIVTGIVLFTPSHVCRECSSRFGFSPPRTTELPEKEVSEAEARKLDVPCPRCGSIETYRISRRRLKATTMVAAILANVLLVFMVFWPFLAKRECDNCGLRW